VVQYLTLSVTTTPSECHYMTFCSLAANYFKMKVQILKVFRTFSLTIYLTVIYHSASVTPIFIFFLATLQYYVDTAYCYRRSSVVCHNHREFPLAGNHSIKEQLTEMYVTYCSRLNIASTLKLTISCKQSTLQRILSVFTPAGKCHANATVIIQAIKLVELLN